MKLDIGVWQGVAVESVTGSIELTFEAAVEYIRKMQDCRRLDDGRHDCRFNVVITGPVPGREIVKLAALVEEVERRYWWNGRHDGVGSVQYEDEPVWPVVKGLWWHIKGFVAPVDPMLGNVMASIVGDR